jgi:hypothetical protein
MTIFNIAIHAAQNRRFLARAQQEPGVNEVVPQMKVGLDPHVGITQ